MHPTVLEPLRLPPAHYLRPPGRICSRYPPQRAQLADPRPHPRSFQTSAQALEARGIEMVVGDLDHPDTLTAVFSGAHAIFAITDFWQPSFNSENRAKLKEGQIMNQYCFDREVQQGKNIAHAAAKVETSERYVYPALSDAKKWSKGKYTWVYHFDGKAKVVEYIKAELPALAKKMSVVQIGLYATHWQTAPFPAPRKV